MIYFQKIRGYKYRLAKKASIVLEWLKGISYDSDFVKITPDGTLTAKKGYAWDGPSGLTIDTRDSLQGSLWHDIGYQLIRAGVLSKALYKPKFDGLLYDTCVKDGMWKWRAELWLRGVIKLGEFWGLGDDRHGQIYTAP